MIRTAAERRARIDRWIITLNPMFEVIQSKCKKLNLGEPRLHIGPTYVRRDTPSEVDKIRRGAVWFCEGVHCGFHVDFLKNGLHIEAWTGQERRVSVWIAGAYTEASLKKDLNLVLAASGLANMAGSSAVRSVLNGR